MKYGKKVIGREITIEIGGMKPPCNFTPIDLEVANSWQKWVEQYDFYMKAKEKDMKDSDVQVAILLTVV